MDSSMATDMTSPGERDDPERFDPEQSSGLLVDAEHRSRYWAAVPLASGRRVLDAGCGTGYGTAMLAQPASGATSVTAIDVAPEAIEATRSRVPDTVNLVQTDIHRLPFADKSFDLITCFEVIEHVTEQESVLDELRRLLADDGLLIISSPNRLVYPAGNPHHVHEYTPGELREQLEARFETVAFYRQHSWLATAVLDAESAGVDMGEPIGAADVRLLSPLATDGETYVIAVATPADKAPSLTQQAVLAENFEVRWWHEQLDGAREQAAEADAQRVRRQQELEQERERMRDLTGHLDFARRRILDLEAESAELVDMRRRLAESRSERLSFEQEVQAVLAERDEELARRQAMLEGLESSLSWRITAPLRNLKRRLGR
jgi:2-polyprenyl-3-methyl-5-hydroxy-6-metoxy-1,4-benzoquinol methylase